MTNPLLEEVSTQMPGVTVSLPTGGIYYGPEMFTPGADVNDLTVNVLNMTDEIRFRDPYLLATGRAMRDMVARLCPEIVYPDRLCDVDIECIILAARMASYGDQMEIEITCRNPEMIIQKDPDGTPTGKTWPVCEAKEKMVILLTDLMFKYGPIENLDDYILLLQPYGQLITFKPLSHEMSLRVTKMMMQRAKQMKILEEINEDDEALLDDEAMDAYMDVMNTSVEMTVDMIVDSIFTVRTKSGILISDKDMINEWIVSLPSDKIEEINIVANRLHDKVQGLSKFPYVCPSCKYEQEVPLILDADKLFLSKPEPSLAPMKSSVISEKSAGSPTKRSRSLPKSHITQTAQ